MNWILKTRLKMEDQYKRAVCTCDLINGQLYKHQKSIWDCHGWFSGKWIWVTLSMENLNRGPRGFSYATKWA